jgi:phosphatidylinositol-3-phosphatase
MNGQGAPPPSRGRRTALGVGAVAVLAIAIAIVLSIGPLAGLLGPGSSPGPSTGSSASPSLRSSASPVGSPASGTPVPSAMGTPPLPAFRHVYLLVMENEERTSIVGNPEAPFLNGLIARYASATRYSAVAHPSQPNYVALFSGSTHGITDDENHDLSGPTLADQIEAQGRSWAVFAESVPSGCYAGAVASGGADGPGTYARKHEPAISFNAIRDDPARCARITDFTHFDPAAADFELIVPNLCHDMHDCSIADGDAFLASFVPRITGSPEFAGSVLFVVWDEGTTDVGGGGEIAAIAVSPLVRAGTQSAEPYTHYSLLRTIETAWGLGCLGSACEANDLRALFVP